MSRILPLSAEAVSQIHSSKQVTSLQGVVAALIENSLDAGANRIEISVDFRRGCCTVEDNGNGILPLEFEETGGLGKMYHTSKVATSPSGELHGKTGTYLASLAALSLMSITSRHKDYPESSTVVLHNSKVLRRHLRTPQSYELLLSPMHGTRVTIRDLFGNMPVRVKQRAAESDARSDDEKVWQDVKRVVVASLLAWPKPCAIRFFDQRAANRVINITGHHPGASSALTSKSLNQLAGKSERFDLRDALPMLYQAGLAAGASRPHWIPLSASTGSISVRGSICHQPVATRQCQFISIGIHACSPSNGHNELYESVNKIFGNSSFGVIDDLDEMDEEENLRRKRDRRYKSDGYTQKQLQGRKGVEKWPMFVLQVNMGYQHHHHSMVENASEGELKAVIEILEAVVMHWLSANHFRPRKRKQRRQESRHDSDNGPSGSSRPSSAASEKPLGGLLKLSTERAATIQSTTTSKKRRVIDLSDGSRRVSVTGQHSLNEAFNTWSRIKSGNSQFYDDLWLQRKPSTASSGMSKPPDPNVSLKTPRKAVVHVSSLEKGQLNGAKLALPRKEATFGSETLLTLPAHPSAIASSDDFGSIDENALLSVAEQAAVNAEVDNAPNSSVETGAFDEVFVDWTDPASGHVFKVNSRTGVILPAKPKDSPATSNPAITTNRPTAAISTQVSSAGRPLSLARRKVETPSLEEEKGSWLPGFLKEWNNPVFHQQNEAPIPVATIDGPGIDFVEYANQRRDDQHLTDHFAQMCTTGSSKLSKAALKEVQVIKQVDRKFILCKLPGDGAGDESLIIVDQHAASERVILEGLLAEIFTPIDPSTPAATLVMNTGFRSVVTTSLLERPLRFQVSELEYGTFAKHAQHFANWGVMYDISRSSQQPTSNEAAPKSLDHRITVRALPPGIAERCTFFPNLLIELLRTEVWALADQLRRPSRISIPQSDPKHEHAWLRRLGSCPKGILDMLNSRACRSAIMFNDELSVPQCEELLADLSRCAFPFMCAHGRVSMVPLVDLGGGVVDEEEELDGVWGFGGALGGRARGEVQEGRGYVGAFRDWRKGEM